VAAGGLAPSLTMLEANALDVVTAGNQFFYAAPPGKYKLIGKVSAELPPITNVVGVSTDKAIKERPDIIRKLIAGRRKAVEFTEANPNEAADIMARAAKWDTGVTRKAVADLVGTGFWSTGSFGKQDMQNAVEGLVLVEALPATVDWKKYVDEQFLPADLRTLGKK
jgi:NitT/TauT family transport system substrate-binding protein